jgi:HK97 family phage prohead protease
MVKPVTGHPDVFAFNFDFVPEAKALDDGTTPEVVTELENGDLLIEGYAAVFDGMDRENENFADGAFTAGIKSFLSGQAGLCFQHKHDKLLGKVLNLESHEGKGLWMKARVDGAIQKHPELGVLYEQIKRGSLNALSVGGFFKRDYGRRKITGVDFTEISVTPVPVHPGTNFAVVAGKALADITIPSAPDVDDVRSEDEQAVRWAVEELERIFSNIERGVAARKASAGTATT